MTPSCSGCLGLAMASRKASKPGVPPQSSGDPGQISRHRLSAPRVDRPAADFVPVARGADRTLRPKRIPQDRQLLLHRPAAAAGNPADNLNPSSHTTAHMTGRMSARSTRLAIIHPRPPPSKGAAISASIPHRARRPTAHGYD